MPNSMEPTPAQLQKQIDELKNEVIDLRKTIMGSTEIGDIEAMAFIVMMAAAKSAQEDLKAIMAEMKSMNKAKQRLRELIAKSAIDIILRKGHKLKERQLKLLLSWLIKR